MLDHVISMNDTSWVRSRADLVTYVQQLSREAAAHPETWENLSLDRYLDALGAWVESMDGYFLNRGKAAPEQPDWGLIASMLGAAVLYE
jgi:hypothetical protein